MTSYNKSYNQHATKLIFLGLLTMVHIASATDTIALRSRLSNPNAAMVDGTTVTFLGGGGICHLHGPAGRGSTLSCDESLPNDAILFEGYAKDNVTPLTFTLGDVSTTDWPDIISVDGPDNEDGVQIETMDFNDGDDDEIIVPWFKMVDNGCGLPKGNGARTCLTLYPGHQYTLIDVYKQDGNYVLELEELPEVVVTYVTSYEDSVYVFDVDILSCDYIWNAPLNKCRGVPNLGSTRRLLPQEYGRNDNTISNSHLRGGGSKL